jgi:hypothetical protein
MKINLQIIRKDIENVRYRVNTVLNMMVSAKDDAERQDCENLLWQLADEEDTLRMDTFHAYQEMATDVARKKDNENHGKRAVAQ